MPKRRQKRSEAEVALLEALEEFEPSGQKIPPGPPPGWGADPPILGSDLNRFYQAYRHLSPQLLEDVQSITGGPDSLNIGRMLRESPELLGTGLRSLVPISVLGSRTREPHPWYPPPPLFKGPDHIYVSLHLGERSRFAVLGHELAHGYGGRNRGESRLDSADLDNKLVDLYQEYYDRTLEPRRPIEVEFPKATRRRGHAQGK